MISFKYGIPRNKPRDSECTYLKEIPVVAHEFDNDYVLCNNDGSVCTERKLFTYKHEGLKASRNVNENKLENNLSRAKSRIFEYAMCNDFEYFVTLTLDPKKYNRHDLKKFVKDLGKMIQNHFNRKNIFFKYLLIPEQHKDGSWHMHGLFTDIPRELLSINQNGYLDFPLYSDKFGYCSLSKIKDKIKCASYITKYVSKDLGINIDKNCKCYYASRGLKKAEKIFSGNLDKNIMFDFENDFVCLKNFNENEFCDFINNYSF